MTKAPYDIVVVGAGHNTLTTAAYLARSGLSVLVLEKNAQAGGGAFSREATLPGFVHDMHATGVGHLQTHPILTQDELGLTSKYGLEFAYTPINAMSLFPDGDTLANYTDLDKTCQEIAKYSQKDADAYRKMVKFMEGVLPLIGMSMTRPPVSFGNFVGLLEKVPFGNDLMLAMMKSAYDIVIQMFEHPKVRMHFLKWAADTSCGPEEKTTGLNMLFLMGGSHAHPIGVTVGGTQSLTRAMIACIEAHGGEVRLNAPVKRVINKGGEAKSVEMADGSVISAKRAVLASIHPHCLGDMVEGLDARLVQRARETSPGSFGTMTVHAALDSQPTWNVGERPNQAFCTNIIGTTDFEEFRRVFDDLRYGAIPKTFIGGVIVNSIFDKTRAPAGKHTLYCYVFSPSKLKDGGVERWDAIKEERTESIMQELAKYAPGLSGANVLARTSETPLDMVRHSPSFQGGDIMGLGSYLYQSLGMRPTPELSQYRVPGASGLYLAGPFMHPGGGIVGGGRAAAIRIMEDLKVDYTKIIRS